MLVDHPRTRFINFTGSKEVGLRIAERSAKVHPGQLWLKRAYMEMGGKDAMIVCADADLERAAGQLPPGWCVSADGEDAAVVVDDDGRDPDDVPGESGDLVPLDAGRPAAGRGR